MEGSEYKLTKMGYTNMSASNEAIEINSILIKTIYQHSECSAFKLYKPLAYINTATIFTDDGKLNTLLYLLYTVENIKNYKVVDMVKEKGFSLLIKEGFRPIILDGEVLDIEETLFSVKIKTKSHQGLSCLIVLNKDFTINKIKYFFNFSPKRIIPALCSFMLALFLSNLLLKIRNSKLSIFSECDFSDIETPKLLSEYEFTDIDSLVFDTDTGNLIKIREDN